MYILGGRIDMKNNEYKTQSWEGCGGPPARDWTVDPGDRISKYGVPSTVYETEKERNVVQGLWYVADGKIGKKVTAFVTALIFAWSMCITPVMAETINVTGGSIDVNVQDKITNWNVTGHPVWDMPEFNVEQGSIYNIAGLGSGASLALLVNGGHASNIFGTMNLSNLDFILQNIAGINIGASAMINVNNASLIASTLPLNLSATDFFNRKYAFEGQGGFLMNEGKIVGSNADLVALVGNAIENRGVIEVPMGTVALAAGDTVAVGISGDGLVTIGVDPATANKLGLKDQIKNSGTISAQGGRVVLSAKAIDGLFDKAINIGKNASAMTAIKADDGSIEFQSMDDIYNNAIIEAMNGQIKIESTQGDVTNKGTLRSDQGSIEIHTEGTIETDGVIQTKTFREHGYTFLMSGAIHVGHAYLDNTDGFAAINGTRDITAGTSLSGVFSDSGSIRVMGNFTLAGDTTLWADDNVDGIGAILWSADYGVTGAVNAPGHYPEGVPKYSLTLKASEDSTVGRISNVSIFTLDESKAGSNPTYTVAPTTAWTNITDFRIANADLNRFTGTGTPGDPFKIYDVYGLQAMEGFLTSNFKLANDVSAASVESEGRGWNSYTVDYGWGSYDLSPKGFVPVGDEAHPFEGSFDGDGHSITGNSSGGYWFSNWDDRNVGIFGVTQNASIQNLTITNLTVLGDPAHGSIGVLVGKAIDTDVSGVSVTGGRVWKYLLAPMPLSAGGEGTGTIFSIVDLAAMMAAEVDTIDLSANDGIGGLIGSAWSGTTIINCSFSGSVGPSDQGVHYEIPLPSQEDYNQAVYENGYYPYYTDEDVVTFGLWDVVGGLVGQLSNSSVTGSTAAGSAIGRAGVGGLVGISWNSTIDSSHATNTVTGTESTGGLVGANILSTISGSSSTGNVNGVGFRPVNLGADCFECEDQLYYDELAQVPNARQAYMTGGLVGYNKGGTLSGVNTASGTVTGKVSVGGLIGEMLGGTVDGATATGNVSGTHSVGGFVGRTEQTATQMTTIQNSTATGDVTGGEAIGGFVGWHKKATIADSTAEGTVTGTSANLAAGSEMVQGIGGFGGMNDLGKISDSYALGDVIAPDGFGVGAFVGIDHGGTYRRNVRQDSELSDIGGSVVSVAQDDPVEPPVYEYDPTPEDDVSIHSLSELPSGVLTPKDVAKQVLSDLEKEQGNKADATDSNDFWPEDTTKLTYKIRDSSYRDPMDNFGRQMAPNFTTTVEVAYGEVYVKDLAEQMNLLGAGEGLRVDYKAPETASKDSVVAVPVNDEVSHSSIPPTENVKPPEVKAAIPEEAGTSVQPEQKVDPKDVMWNPAKFVAAQKGSRAESREAGWYGTLQDTGKDVFYRIPGGEWQAAKDGMTILAGDEVRTAAGATVRVLLGGGSVGQVEVKEGSFFRINKMETESKTGDKTTLLDLALGKVLVHVEKLQGKSKFEVRTPTALTGVRGTTFTVEVREKA